MSIIDSHTGKVLMTDKQLIKEVKKWLASKTNKQLIRELKKMEKENKQ